MVPKDDNIHLFLACADDHRPVLEEGLSHDAPADEAGDEDLFDSFYNPSAGGNDLAEQGWGVVAPIGDDGDRLLEVIAPLLKAREEELGERPKIFRVPSVMDAADADAWRRDVYDNDDPRDMPFYQLFLGDLDQTPLALQQAQATDGAVGRLAFSRAEDYESYVDKLLRWERAPSLRPPDLLFHTVNDGTPATAMGASGLVAPVVERASQSLASGRLRAGMVDETGDSDEPSPDQLLRAARDHEASLLFSLSHGEGAPRQGWASREAQRAGQGAMSFGRGGSLRAADVTTASFLPGGMWFMFACYGAGTPGESRFRHWLEQLRDAGKFRGRPEAVLRSLPQGDERPFVAALPKAALANPSGPLAFLGHLDLAWTYSFQELDRGRREGRAGKFYKVLLSLLLGDRIGLAMRELTRYYLDKNQVLSDAWDEQRAAEVDGALLSDQRARLAHLWMVRQDLAGYTVLGDPAARLPQGSGEGIQAARGSRREAAEAITSPSPAPAPAADPSPEGPVSSSADIERSAPAPAPSAEALDRRVEAVHALIVGDLGIRKIAETYGIPRPTLEAMYEAYLAAGRRALASLSSDA